MNVGIYSDISNADYHSGSGLSASGLKLLARSPAHYKYTVRKETPAMRLGTAVHTAILEPERFKEEYVAAVGIDKRSKAGKEAVAHLETQGKIILGLDEYTDVEGMAEAVQNDEIAGQLVVGGRAEHSIAWNTSVIVNGSPVDVLCKCRPDYLKEADGRYNIIDLKTTEDARLPAFTRTAYDYGYHLQSAFYHTGCMSVLELPVGLFAFIAVEKKPPYAVSVYVAGQDFMNLGHTTNSRLISLYAKCMAEDKWPAYESEIQSLGVPTWAK